MIVYELIGLVKDREARYEYFRDGVLYYRVSGTEFIFGVPVDDVGTATLKRDEKAITLMRWIRPALETWNEAVRQHDANTRGK